MDEPELPLAFPAAPPTAAISDLVRFGTSTWTYEGWQGQVYKRPYAKTSFARECLGEFCQYLYKGKPLFRTVGNDSTFYRPPTTNQIIRYLSQIPEDFEMCCKSLGRPHHSDVCQARPIWTTSGPGQPQLSQCGPLVCPTAEYSAIGKRRDLRAEGQHSRAVQWHFLRGSFDTACGWRQTQPITT